MTLINLYNKLNLINLINSIINDFNIITKDIFKI
jgi:hypothetical protein